MSHHCCLPGCTLSGEWNLGKELGLPLGSQMWDVGVLPTRLETLPVQGSVREDEVEEDNPNHPQGVFILVEFSWPPFQFILLVQLNLVSSSKKSD